MQKRKKTLFAAGIGAMAVILAAIAFQYGRDKGYFSFYREGAVLPVIREGKTDQIEKSDDRKKQLMMYVSDTTGLYNPAFVQTSGDQAVSSLIFQPLMEETMEGGMKAVLADEVSVSEDGLMYQVMLKGNRKFSDGTVVSADDVIASVAAEMLLHGEEEDSPYGRIKGYEQFVQDQREFPSGLRKLGDREVIIEFTQADPDNRKVLLTEIQKAVFTENMEDGQFKSRLDAICRKGIGSGPYCLRDGEATASTVSEGVRLVRNDQYDRKFGDIEEIVVNTSASYYLEESIASGEIDTASWTGDSMAFQAFYEAERYTVYEKPGENVYGLFFNPDQTVFQNDQVRKAMAAALNRNAVINEKLSRYISMKDSFALNQVSVYDPEKGKEQAKKGLEQAVSLMKTAKQQLGIEEDIQLKLPVISGNEIQEELASHVKELLDQCGFQVTVEAMDQGSYMNTLFLTEDYDILLSSCTINGDYRTFDSLYRGTGVCQMYMTENQEQALGELAVTYDPDGYGKAVKKLTDAMDQDIPFILLGSNKYYLAVSADLSGYAISPELLFFEDASRIKVD